MDEVRRKEHRLKYYDYSKANLYFITIDTYDKKDIFGIIKDDKMILNNVGKILNDNYSLIFDNGKAEIICFQIMPNHIHFILELKNDGDITLPGAVSYFKASITKKIGIKPLWMRGYFDRVIRDEKEFKNVYNYIVNNPYRDKYKW